MPTLNDITQTGKKELDQFFTPQWAAPRRDWYQVVDLHKGKVVRQGSDDYET